MRFFALIVWVVSMSWSPAAFADTIEDFGKQMSYFYLAPSQEAFSVLQKNANQFRDKIEGANNGADTLVAVLIARVSQKYQWPIGGGVFGDRAKEIIEGKSTLAKYVSDNSQVDPSKIDVWWADFFATGDEQYLENIFQYTGGALPMGGDEKALVAGSANWSFKANCRQHEKVLEFARKKLKSASLPEAQVKFVNECIAFANRKEY
jgi:hypothetical protein